MNKKIALYIIALLLFPIYCIAEKKNLFPFIWSDNVSSILYAEYDKDGEFTDFKKYTDVAEFLVWPKDTITPRMDFSSVQQEFDSVRNEVLDSLALIDWINDTVTIISGGDICFGYTDDIIKTRKDTVRITIRSSNKSHNIEIEKLSNFVMDSDIIFSAEMKRKYETLLSWDLEKIKQILFWSHGPFLNDYFDTFRIIINNHLIQKVDWICIPEYLYWRLGPDDFPGQKMIEEMKEQNRKNKEYKKM